MAHDDQRFAEETCPRCERPISRNRLIWTALPDDRGLYAYGAWSYRITESSHPTKHSYFRLYFGPDDAYDDELELVGFYDDLAVAKAKAQKMEPDY